MDAVTFMQCDVSDQAVTCDVLRPQDSGPYDSGFSSVGTIDVTVFEPSSQQRVTIEGTSEDTSLTGLAVPQYDNNGDLQHVVQVSDRLKPQSNPQRQYDVRAKNGLPNELEPELWQLGLDVATSSE